MVEVTFEYMPERPFKKWVVTVRKGNQWVQNSGQSFFEGYKLCMYEAQEFGFICIEENT